MMKTKKKQSKKIYLFAILICASIFASIFYLDRAMNRYASLPPSQDTGAEADTGNLENLLANRLNNLPVSTGRTTGTVIELPTVEVCVIKALNVRECPDILCAPIYWLLDKEIIQVSYCENDWGYIPELDGFVYGEFLTPNPCLPN